MYIVTLLNGDQATEVHNRKHKLSSGNIVKGINSIDSFSFTATPKNPAFNNVHDFLTLVEVYNTNRRRYEFQGRVLCSIPSMSDKGLLLQEVTCESFFGYLCDSQQLYVEEKNWTKRELLAHLISTHNGQMESYKHFKIGVVDNPDVNVYCGIQRENTWETIKKKLLESEGGEIRFRVLEDGIYIDYLEQIGETKSTKIAVSKNMKTIIKEQDPSAFITRLIPLGCKLKTTDADGNETDSEQRLDISTVNEGKTYIDDEDGIEAYGIHVGYVEFDDVTEPENLLSKGRQWMENNNKVLVKYSITALDLSLLGLDPDDFEMYNFYPVKNRYLGIDDVARVVKKNIDICDETKSTMEIGESFKTLSELQREKLKAIEGINADIVEIRRNYATNQKLNSEITKTVSLIDQRAESIVLSVTGGTVDPEDYETFEQFAQAAYSASIGKYSADLKALTQWKGTASESLATLQQTVGENTAALLLKASVNDINNALDLYGSGRNLLKNTRASSTIDATGILDGNNKDAIYAPTEALVSEQVYTFSADVEIEEGSATHITIGVSSLLKNVYVDLPITDGHISGQIVTPSNVVNQFHIYAGKRGETKGNRITLTHRKLEKGDRATKWTPAPEDVATNQEVTAQLELKIEENNGNLISIINAAADVIQLTSNRLSIQSDKFTLTPEGAITCSDVTITGGTVQIPGNSGGYNCSAELSNGSLILEADSSRLSFKMNYGGLTYDTTEDNKYRQIRTGLDTLTLYWPEIYLLSENVYTWDSKYSAKRQGLTGIVDKSDYMLFVNGILIEVGASSTAFSSNPHGWLHDSN